MIIQMKSAYLKKFEERQKYNGDDKWFDWFAWYPTRVDERTIAWFRVIQRRRNYVCSGSFFYFYEYRLK